MHLETIQHLRGLAVAYDDLVPIAKPLLLDLLDSYERHADKEHRLLTGLVESERDLAEIREAGTPACWIAVGESMPETLVPVIVYGILEGEYQHDRHEAFRRHIGARDPWRSPRMENDENLRIREVTHWMPMPAAPDTPPVNEVPSVTPVPAPETFEAHGHTWTRHTPGDRCPIAPDALVFVLWPSDMVTDCSDVIAVACDFDWSTRPAPDEQIIGWRYATPQPSTPDK